MSEKKVEKYTDKSLDTDDEEDEGDEENTEEYQQSKSSITHRLDTETPLNINKDQKKENNNSQNQKKRGISNIFLKKQEKKQENQEQNPNSKEKPEINFMEILRQQKDLILSQSQAKENNTQNQNINQDINNNTNNTNTIISENQKNSDSLINISNNKSNMKFIKKLADHTVSNVEQKQKKHSLKLSRHQSQKSQKQPRNSPSNSSMQSSSYSEEFDEKKEYIDSLHKSITAENKSKNNQYKKYTEQDEIYEKHFNQNYHKTNNKSKFGNKHSQQQQQTKKQVQQQNTNQQSIKEENMCEICGKEFTEQQIQSQKIISCQICNKIKAHEACAKYQNNNKKRKAINLATLQRQFNQWKCKNCQMQYGTQAWDFIINKLYTARANIFIFRIRALLLIRTQYYLLTKQQINYMKQQIQDKTFSSRDDNDEDNRLIKLLQIIPILSPLSPLFTFWNFILFSAISFKIFEIPLVIAFELQDRVLMAYQIPIFLLFLFEILFQFNVGYFDQGLIVLDRAKIKQHYINGKFKYDIITTFFLMLSIFMDRSDVGIPFLIRALQVQEILVNAENQLHMAHKKNQIYYIIFALLKLLNLVFFVAHFLGSGFHFIAIYETNRNEHNYNWLKAQGYEDLSEYERYIHSLYFSIISMSTIGYGDISPQTINERIYIICSTCISCGVFAYSLNVVTTIFQDLSNVSYEFRKQKSEILSYMAQRQIKNELQIKIIKNFEHQQLMEQIGISKSNQILNGLSQNLVKDIKHDFYLRILKEIMLLHANFSFQFLQDLSQQMFEQTMAPDEILINKNETIDNLYYIFKGSIGYYKVIKNSKGQDKEMKLYQKNEGQVIGSNEFFTKKSSNYYIKSSDITQLIVISKTFFNKILKQYPLDLERYYQIQDQLKYEQDHDINYKFQYCDFCKNFGHNFLICPYLYPHTNKGLTLKKFLLKEQHVQQQDRQKLPYKSIKKLIQINSRRLEKYHTFFDQINNQKTFTNTRNDSLAIRKKYVLQHIANLKELHIDNQQFPFDFFNTISNHIQEEFTEELNDEQFQEMLPGVIITNKFNNQKKDQQNFMESSSKSQITSRKSSEEKSEYNKIQNFDYNYQKDTNKLIVNYFDIYQQAKELQMHLNKEDSSSQIIQDNFSSISSNDSSSSVQSQQQSNNSPNKTKNNNNTKNQNQNQINLMDVQEELEEETNKNINIPKQNGLLSQLIFNQNNNTNNDNKQESQNDQPYKIIEEPVIDDDENNQNNAKNKNINNNQNQQNKKQKKDPEKLVVFEDEEEDNQSSAAGSSQKQSLKGFFKSKIQNNQKQEEENKNSQFISLQNIISQIDKNSPKKVQSNNIIIQEPNENKEKENQQQQQQQQQQDKQPQQKKRNSKISMNDSGKQQKEQNLSLLKIQNEYENRRKSKLSTLINRLSTINNNRRSSQKNSLNIINQKNLQQQQISNQQQKPSLGFIFNKNQNQKQNFMNESNQQQQYQVNQRRQSKFMMNIINQVNNQQQGTNSQDNTIIQNNRRSSQISDLQNMQYGKNQMLSSNGNNFINNQNEQQIFDNNNNNNNNFGNFYFQIDNQQEEKKQDNKIYITDFEQAKLYLKYFSNFNYTYIIKKYEKYRVTNFLKNQEKIFQNYASTMIPLRNRKKNPNNIIDTMKHNNAVKKIELKKLKSIKQNGNNINKHNN